MGHRATSAEARRLIDICLEAGVTLVRHRGRLFERRVESRSSGEAVQGRRGDVLTSTKTGLPMGDGPQDWGASRSRARSARSRTALKRRLGTDRIDLLQLHAFDASTPVEELMGTLDRLIAAGKLRYAGVSNYPGLAVDEGAGRRRASSARRASSRTRSIILADRARL